MRFTTYACFITRVACLLLPLGCLPVGHAAADAPPRQKKVLTQQPFFTVPGTFEQLWTRAEIIARVRIIGARVGGSPSSGTIPNVFTEYTGSVLAIEKGGHRVAGTIRFRHWAGSLELEDKIVTVPQRPQLANGREYYVFLRESQGTLWLAHDLEGAFEVVDGTIVSRGFGTVAKQQHGLSDRQFRDQIEYVGRHAAKPR